MARNPLHATPRSAVTLVWFCLILWAPPAFTQAREPRPPARLRFLILEESPGGYLLEADDSVHSLTNAPYAISPPITPGEGAVLKIFKTHPVPNPETGEVPRTLIATLKPPQESASALVILRPRANTPGGYPYHVEIIDSDPGVWPAGSLRILNRGHVNMAAIIDEQMVTVEPGAERVVPLKGDHRHRVRARIATRDPEGWQLIDDNIAIVKPTTRMTGLMVFSPSGLRFRFDEYLIATRGPPPPSHVWLTYSDTPDSP